MAETCRHRVTTRAGCWTRCGSAGSPRWSWQWPTLMTPSPGSRCSHTCSAAGAASTRPTSTPGNPGQARQQETHQPNRRSSSGAKDPENRNRLWGHLKNRASTRSPLAQPVLEPFTAQSPRTLHAASTALVVHRSFGGSSWDAGGYLSGVDADRGFPLPPAGRPFRSGPQDRCLRGYVRTTSTLELGRCAPQRCTSLWPGCGVVKIEDGRRCPG